MAPIIDPDAINANSPPLPNSNTTIDFTQVSTSDLTQQIPEFISLYESEPISEVSQLTFYQSASIANSLKKITIDGTDSLEMHVLFAEQPYSSIYNLDNWSIRNENNTSLLETNTIQHLNDLDIYSGKYTIIYNGYTNIYPDSIGECKIEDISSDRTEIKIKLKSNLNETGNITHNLGRIPVQNSKGFSTNVSINFLNNIIIESINCIKTSDRGLVYKLITPIPDSININDPIYVIIPLFNQVKFDIILYSESIPSEVTILNQPNWLANKSIHSKRESSFYNWDTLLAYNPTGSNQLINHYLSGSLSGMKLNIEYSEYSNFIFYSSATERLKNFKYKLGLIESYNSIINTLDTEISSSTVIDTITLSNNLIKYNQKLNNLLGTFDEYENYLYYESSSNDIESPTWPKLNSTKPYQLYSITSSYISDEWYDSQLYTSSLYDTSNVNSLINTIPEYIYEDELNAGYITFIQMISHHYDILWLYIKSLSELYDRQESITKGLPKDLIYHVLQSFGWEPSFGNQFNDLWINAYGDDVKTINEPYLLLNPIPTEDITKQIWKRILNNLPFLLKNSGTAEGIRALINCYGVPETILKIREYGGPNKIDSISTLTSENYGYAWKVIPSGSYYFNCSVSNAFHTELRFKLEDATTVYSINNSNKALLTYTSESIALGIISINHKKYEYGDIKLHFYNGIDYDIFNFSNLPIYNGKWNNIAFTTNAANDALIMYLKQTTDGEITYETSSSIPMSSIPINIFDTTDIQVPGSIYYTGSTSYNIFDMELQEFRLWDTYLDSETLITHALNPISYAGNNPTSSYNDLLVRLPFGSEGKIPNDLVYTYTSSLDISIFTQSYHPNQNVNNALITEIPISMSLIPYELIYTAQYPDISTNRNISNKIRIETNNSFDGNVLDLNKRTEQSSYDSYPIDSPKIGVYFSPTNEINDDIANQMGGFSIDNYIGDYSDNYNSEYKDLNGINNDYFKKYNKKYNFNEYLNLLKFYDYSLFNQIKRMIPARSKGLIGHVIEPHILNRSKIKLYDKPSSEDLSLETILTTDNYESGYLSGESNTIDGNLIYIYTFDSSSVLDTVITGSVYSSHLQTSYLILSSSDWISGSQYLELDLSLNNETGEPWFNPENIITTASAIYTITPSTTFEQKNSKLLTVQYTQSNFDYTDVYDLIGIELKMTKSTNANTQYRYAKDKYVKIGKQPITDVVSGNNYNKLDAITTTPTEYKYGGIVDKWGQNITKYSLNGLWAGIGFLGVYNTVGHPANNHVDIGAMQLKMHYSVKRYKYAEMSDFEPTDLMNLKYNGCKISSPNFNQPSNDTPDGGPVVEYRIVNPNEIIVEPTVVDLIAAMPRSQL